MDVHFKFYAGENFIGLTWGEDYYNDKKVFHESGRSDFVALLGAIRDSKKPVRVVNVMKGTEIFLNGEKDFEEWVNFFYPYYDTIFKK